MKDPPKNYFGQLLTYATDKLKTETQHVSEREGRIEATLDWKHQT